jgi:hypothetical protein
MIAEVTDPEFAGATDWVLDKLLGYFDELNLSDTPIVSGTELSFKFRFTASPDGAWTVTIEKLP